MSLVSVEVKSAVVEKKLPLKEHFDNAKVQDLREGICAKITLSLICVMFTARVPTTHGCFTSLNAISRLIGSLHL